jgi:hypothetical protein
MSITFTDQLDKPSEITAIPNQLLRPIFGALYGFDTPQAPVSYWTPASLTTENWYDAADTATITDTSGVVTQWDDKSGNANHLSAVGSGIFTDRRTRNSSNVMDIEEGSYFSKTGYQLPADCSIFMMSAIDSISVNTDALFSINGGGGKNFQFESGDFVSPRNEFLARFSQIGIGTNNTFASTDQKGPSIYELIFDLNGGSDLEVYIDGTSFGTTAYTAQCGPNSQLLLFVNRSLSQFPDGYAAEFIVVPSVLSTTDRQKMEGYLAWKWGLTAQLDVSHPYKTSRPLA